MRLDYLNLRLKQGYLNVATGSQVRGYRLGCWTCCSLLRFLCCPVGNSCAACKWSQIYCILSWKSHIARRIYTECRHYACRVKTLCKWSWMTLITGITFCPPRQLLSRLPQQFKNWSESIDHFVQVSNFGDGRYVVDNITLTVTDVLSCKEKWLVAVISPSHLILSQRLFVVFIIEDHFTEH